MRYKLVNEKNKNHLIITVYKILAQHSLLLLFVTNQ